MLPSVPHWRAPHLESDVTNHEGQLIYMYGRTASSSVESMNHANKPARDRTAVDIMQSMKLIVELETGRFNAKKEMAHE